MYIFFLKSTVSKLLIKYENDQQNK